MTDMHPLLIILDNTFIGTTLAGACAIFFYSIKKKIDKSYELRKQIDDYDFKFKLRASKIVSELSKVIHLNKIGRIEAIDMLIDRVNDLHFKLMDSTVEELPVYFDTSEDNDPVIKKYYDFLMTLPFTKEDLKNADLRFKEIEMSMKNLSSQKNSLRKPKGIIERIKNKISNS